jgi:hypothetical protein
MFLLFQCFSSLSNRYKIPVLHFVYEHTISIILVNNLVITVFIMLVLLRQVQLRVVNNPTQQVVLLKKATKKKKERKKKIKAKYVGDLFSLVT